MEEKHIDRLMAKGLKVKADTFMSLPVARDHGYYAGILYAFLQDQQIGQEGYSERYNVRRGMRWIPKLTVASIVEERPAFPDELTVTRASETLKEAGLIFTETTGAFLEPDHRTGRKRDIATWWHVKQKDVPSEYLDRNRRQGFSALEAAAYEIPQALILAHWRKSVEVEEEVYKRLSAVELEKVLPMDERTARRHLKAMVKAGILIPHEKQKKLYRMKASG